MMGFAARDVEDRQAEIECRIGIAQIVDRLDRAVPHQFEAACITDRDERRQAERAAIVPAFGDHLGTDPGGVAKRDCKRGEQGGHIPAPLAAHPSESR